MKIQYHGSGEGWWGWHGLYVSNYIQYQAPHKAIMMVWWWVMGRKLSSWWVMEASVMILMGDGGLHADLDGWWKGVFFLLL